MENDIEIVKGREMKKSIKNVERNQFFLLATVLQSENWSKGDIFLQYPSQWKENSKKKDWVRLVSEINCCKFDTHSLT